MLRFDAYKNGQRAADVDLSGAYAFGQDGIPIRADLVVEDGTITCLKRTPGACGIALLWDGGKAGSFLLPTTRLPDRDKPYNLNVELARGQLTRIAQKREDWGLFDYTDARNLNTEFNRARKVFVSALQSDDPAEAAAIADKVVSDCIVLGEKIALFHAQVFINRRKASPTAISRAGFGCVVDLFSNTDDYHNRLRESFDFINIPIPWKYTEPQEQSYQYSLVDKWINWAARMRKPVTVGPLLSFDPACVPEWLYIWENDYESLRDVIYEHLKAVVDRYKQHVAVWNVVSGIHACNRFNLTFEQIMELTRMSCLLVKKLAPKASVMIELTLPWSEYYARNQRTIPALLYADMAVQSGTKFDAFGVQMCMGVPVDGHYVRDLLQISMLLDEFVSFGKPVHVTGCQVPSDVSQDPWDHWQGREDITRAGQWHAPWSQRLQAEWLQAFYRIAISKPFVETLTWRDLADYEGHYIPHGGLCKNDMEGKLSYRELKNFRIFLATQTSAVNLKIRKLKR